MKLSLTFLTSFIIACNSTNYEIIEEHSDESDMIITSLPETLSSNAFREKSPSYESHPSVINDSTYEIQIGAFGDKTNADRFYEKSKQILGYVNYTVSDNLTRITYGIFHTLSEAEQNLQMIKNKGYTDAFIKKIPR